MASHSIVLKMTCVAVAISAAHALQKDALQSTFEADTYPTSPRLLVARGCDGSNTIMTVAHGLLRKHGISVSQQKDDEMLTPKNAFYLDAKKDLGMAMDLAIADSINKSESLVFKVGAGRSLEAAWKNSKQSLKKNRVLSVIGSQGNMLDEVICQVQHCAEQRLTGIGHIVNAKGKSADMAADGCEAHKGNQVFLDVKKIVAAIDHEDDVMEQARRQLHMTGFHYGEVDFEKMLAFAQSQDDFDLAVQEWSKFLKTWRVEPDEEIIANHLNNDATKTKVKEDDDHWWAALEHKEVIKNFGEVNEALIAAGPKYAKLIRTQ